MKSASLTLLLAALCSALPYAAAEDVRQLNLRTTAVGMEVRFQGTAGERYDVYASENLQNWESLGPATETVAGDFLLTDTRPISGNGCFYRVNVLAHAAPGTIHEDPCLTLRWDMQGLKQLLGELNCDDEVAELQTAQQALAEAQARKDEAQEAWDDFQREKQGMLETLRRLTGDSQRVTVAAAHTAETARQAFIDAANEAGLSINPANPQQPISLGPNLWGDAADLNGEADEAMRQRVYDAWMEAINGNAEVKAAYEAYQVAHERRLELEERDRDIEKRRSELAAERNALLNALERACEALTEAEEALAAAEAALKECEDLITLLLADYEILVIQLEICEKANPIRQAINELHEGLNEINGGLWEADRVIREGGDGNLFEEPLNGAEAGKQQEALDKRQAAREAKAEARRLFDEAADLWEEARRCLAAAESGEATFEEAEAKVAAARLKSRDAERTLSRALHCWIEAEGTILCAREWRQNIVAQRERERQLRLGKIKPVPILPQPLNVTAQQVALNAKTMLARAFRDGPLQVDDSLSACEKKALQASMNTNAEDAAFLFEMLVNIFTAPLQLATGNSGALQFGLAIGKSLLQSVASGDAFTDRAAEELFAFAGGKLFPKLVGDEYGDAVNDLVQGGIEELSREEDVVYTTWNGEFEGCDVTTTALANRNTGYVLLLIKLEGCPVVAVSYRMQEDGTVSIHEDADVETIG